MPTFGDKFLTNFQASKAEATRRAQEAQIHDLRIQQLNEQIRSNQAAEEDRDAAQVLREDIHRASTVEGEDGERQSVQVAQLKDILDRRVSYTDPDTGETVELSPAELLAEGNEETRQRIAQGHLEAARSQLGLSQDQFEFLKQKYRDAQALQQEQMDRYDRYVEGAVGVMSQPHPVAEAIENKEELNVGEGLFNALVAPTTEALFGWNLPSIRRKQEHNRGLLTDAIDQTRQMNAGLMGLQLRARAETPLPMSIAQSQGMASAAGANYGARELPNVPLRGPGLLGLGEVLGTSESAYDDIARRLEMLPYYGIGSHIQQQGQR